MGKKDDEKPPEKDPCPPEPAGCGGKGWTILVLNGKTHKGDCHVCLGSGEIPKK